MNTIDSTKLIELANSDYKMLKEKGKEGEKVLHYNGFLDGFARGWNEGKKDAELDGCVIIHTERCTDVQAEEIAEAIADFLTEKFPDYAKTILN